jgi:hypothetical protein
MIFKKLALVITLLSTQAAQASLITQCIDALPCAGTTILFGGTVYAIKSDQKTSLLSKIVAASVFLGLSGASASMTLEALTGH